MEDFRAHTAGKAAIKNTDKPASGYMAKPFCQSIKRDAGCGEVVDVSIVGDQFVGFAAVSRKGDHNDVVWVTRCKLCELLCNRGAGCVLVGKQHRIRPQCIGKKSLEGRCIPDSAAKPTDIY